MIFTVKTVVSFPREFEPGVLYWSKEFEMSAHKCACGCGDVIQVPVDPQNFSITETATGPTMRPSIGNWGVCDAHYYITAGKVQWLQKLSREHIASSRAYENARRETHYATLRPSMVARIKTWWNQLWK